MNEPHPPRELFSVETVATAHHQIGVGPGELPQTGTERVRLRRIAAGQLAEQAADGALADRTRRTRESLHKLLFGPGIRRMSEQIEGRRSQLRVGNCVRKRVDSDADCEPIEGTERRKPDERDLAGSGA